MNVNALFYAISNAMNNKDISYIEIVGEQHNITLIPEKIIDVATKQDWLWITKIRSNNILDQILINPNQIVYVRITRKEV